MEGGCPLLIDSLVIMADICVARQNGGEPIESGEQQREGCSLI